MTNPRAKEDFQKATAELEHVIRNYMGGFALGLLNRIRQDGLQMYDEGYLAAQCDRDAAFIKDLGDLQAKYSWM